MVKYRAINTLHVRGAAPKRPLETLLEAFLLDWDAHRERQEAALGNTWRKLPPHLRWAMLAQIEVYLDDFIIVIQEGIAKKTHDSPYLPLH